MSARKAGAVTTTWLTALIVEWNATGWSPGFALAPGQGDGPGWSSESTARPTTNEAEEREARGRELRAAQDLARRRRRQTILASAAAATILALGGAATWVFGELAATRGSQVAQLEYENSVLSQLLRQEYQQRFDGAKVLPVRQEMVAQSVRKILGNRARYERITRSMTMPWYFLAIIHGLEADFRFNSHLHNGDPLTGRTVRVPAGRPRRARRRSAGKRVRRMPSRSIVTTSGTIGALPGCLSFGNAITALDTGIMASIAVRLGVHRPLCEGSLCCRRPVRGECRIEAMRRSGDAQGTDRDRLVSPPAGPK